MDPDAGNEGCGGELTDPSLLRDLGGALGHRLLHLDRAAHRIDDAGKFDQHPVAGGLEDAPVALGDF